MRSAIIALFFVSFITACSQPKNQTTLKFYDSSGCEYDIATLNSSYEKCYGKAIDANVLVVLATSEGEHLLTRQLNEFNSIDYEKLNLIIVRGYDYKSDKSGYYLNKKDSENLLSKNIYSARLYDSKGILKTHTAEILTERDITNFLKN